MSDVPAKKRAWFQLHLSTCVVLMFVAGALVWANVRKGWAIDNELLTPVTGLDTPTPETAYFEVRGWPLPYQHARSQYDLWDGKKPTLMEVWLDLPLSVPDSDLSLYPLDESIWQHPETWDRTYLAADLGVAVALLVVLAVICEALIRRRARA